MNNNFKYLITILAIIAFLYFINYQEKRKSEDDNYNVEVPKKVITVCGKELWITDFSYDDNIDIYSLISEIEYICEN